jgi:hypothetical protein
VWSTEATASSNVGRYAITGGGLDGASRNYVFNFVQGSGNGTALSITPAPLTLTYTADAVSSTYGVNANSSGVLTGNVAGVGLVNGDDLSVVTGKTFWTSPVNARSDVGTYAVAGYSAGNSNYAITRVQADSNATALTINPAALTVTYYALNTRSVYGSTPTVTGAFRASGLVRGDTLEGVTTGSVVWSTEATASSNVGRYAITGGGLDGASRNYVFNFVQGSGNGTALSIIK